MKTNQPSLPAVDELLEQMTTQLKKIELNNPIMIGIHTGGIWLAKELHLRLKLNEPINTIDITFYRDDFSKIGLQPDIKGSNLPTDMQNRDVILVDDVLYTGRTIRAAMNEIFDYARPDSICLAVLIDRGNRQLPIQADVVGHKINLNNNEQIKLRGPNPLHLEIKRLA